MRSTYDVFLSHSNRDKDFVAKLAEDLTSAGFMVWLDQWNIRPGDSFAGAIADALNSSKFVVIVMSPDYFQSQWTQQEWHSALANEIDGGNVRVIPILYRDCDIPSMLRTKQWVDFRDKAQYTDTFGILVRGLSALANESGIASVSTSEPKLGERVEKLDQGTISELRVALKDAVDMFKSSPQAAQSLIGSKAEVDPSQCFIVMPFSVESLNIVFEDFVKPTLVDRCKLRVERGDDLFGSNVIMDDIAKSIKRSRLIIADLTGKSPNVFYEVGIAHALNKEVLLMTQSIDDVPFDLRHRRALVYEYTPRGCKKLEKDLYENVQKMLGHAQAA